MDYPISLTGEELNVIGNALGARPYAEVNGLITKLKGQCDAHERAQAAAPEAPKPQPAVPGGAFKGVGADDYVRTPGGAPAPAPGVPDPLESAA